MEIKQEIIELLQSTADFAAAVQRKLGWFLGVGLIASLSLAWFAYSATSPTWWNVLKCGFLVLPGFVWLVIWLILGQMREVPELAANLAAREDLTFASPTLDITEKKPGIIALFSTLREIRNNEAFELVTETIGSVTLLANPLVAIFSFAMLAILWIFILISPIVWFF